MEANLNLRIDSQVRAQAQQMFNSMGLDMAEAVEQFFRQFIRQRGMPFSVGEPQDPMRKKTPMPGCMKDKILWIAEDFNEPLEDFKEYME